MAWRTFVDTSAVSAARERLESLPDVQRAVFDEQRNLICLVSLTARNHPDLIEAARAVLRAEGFDVDSLQLELAVSPDAHNRGRVRFLDIEVIPEPERMVRVRVTLDWDADRVTGEAQGERGESIELRTAVSAALHALELLTGESLGVRITGVKRIRAFDAELMVVSLVRDGAPAQKLLGSVLVGSDAHRAAALALLNALNRLLGNYLTTR